MTSDAEVPVNEAYISEVRGRLDAATPGPWLHRDQFIETATEPGQLLGVTMQRNENGLEPLPGNHNACFLAHARVDVARLLAEVERLKRVEADLRRQLANPATDVR